MAHCPIVGADCWLGQFEKEKLINPRHVQYSIIGVPVGTEERQIGEYWYTVEKELIDCKFWSKEKGKCSQE
ncbi:MAG: hypothetical protein PHG83_03965 [Patescibacteria group bacterium]|nr:hypothetical protein [Patescibacteria group bacterium]